MWIRLETNFEKLKALKILPNAPCIERFFMSCSLISLVKDRNYFWNLKVFSISNKRIRKIVLELAFGRKLSARKRTENASMHVVGLSFSSILPIHLAFLSSSSQSQTGWGFRSENAASNSMFKRQVLQKIKSLPLHLTLIFRHLPFSS